MSSNRATKVSVSPPVETSRKNQIVAIDARKVAIFRLLPHGSNKTALRKSYDRNAGLLSGRPFGTTRQCPHSKRRSRNLGPVYPSAFPWKKLRLLCSYLIQALAVLGSGRPRGQGVSRPRGLSNRLLMFFFSVWAVRSGGGAERQWGRVQIIEFAGKIWRILRWHAPANSAPGPV
jgi:hypothetical protein